MKYVLGVSILDEYYDVLLIQTILEEFFNSLVSSLNYKFIPVCSNCEDSANLSVKTRTRDCLLEQRKETACASCGGNETETSSNNSIGCKDVNKTNSSEQEIRSCWKCSEHKKIAKIKWGKEIKSRIEEEQKITSIYIFAALIFMSNQCKNMYNR